MDRMILGPTPTTYVAIKGFTHNGATHEPGMLFSAYRAAGKQLSALLESGAIRRVHPPPPSDRSISVPWAELEALAAAPSGTILEMNLHAVVECHQHGLVGVSPPMLEVIERIAACCDLDTPVLIAGEPGAEQEVAARCVHQLGQRAPGKFSRIRCDGLTPDFVQSKMQRRLQRVPAFLGVRTMSNSSLRSSSDSWKFSPSESPRHEPVDRYCPSLFEVKTLRTGVSDTLFLKDIDLAPREVQVRVIEEIDRGRTRVIASVQRTVKDVEGAVSKGEFPRDLLRAFQRGIIEVPPLCARSGDVPLLIHYFVKRYNRGDYDAPGAEVKLIAAEWLYFTAGRRWPDNLDELERAVVEACRKAARIDGIVCVWRAGDEPPGRVPWPEDCPFALSWPAYIQAAKHDPELQAGVLVEDLLGYDLKALLEAVDLAAEPSQRGRWTVEYRQRHLEEERQGTPPDALRKPQREAAPSVALVAQEGEGTGQDVIVDFPVDEQSRFAFQCKGAHWEGVYNGHRWTVITSDKGMRAIAHLLKVGQPPEGASEVRRVMTGGEPVGGSPWESGSVVETAEEKVMSPQERTLYQDALKNEEETLRAAYEGEVALDPETREEIEERINWMQRELNRGVNRHGRHRIRGGRRDEAAVGAAIHRALGAIERDHPPLYSHLKDAIKNKYTGRIRYESTIEWETEM